VEKIMKQSPPVDVILLDDAFQHRSINAGLSILLIDFTRPINKDCLLPAGMLREPASNRSRANIILITRTPANIKAMERREYVNNLGLSMGQYLYFTCMHYGELRPLFRRAPAKDIDWFRENAGGVLLVTGIANPRPLQEFALSIHGNLTVLSYPDHHRYRARDMEKIRATYRKLKKEAGEILVLTTEKDAVRLQEQEPDPELRDALYAVPIRVHFLNNDKKDFDRKILSYVNSNKRSSILYPGEDS
jgi:tetraacyldisaccharide 4'-kinase